MMLTDKQQSLPSLERVIYEEAQELAKRRKCTVSYALSIMWSNFKSVGEVRGAEAAFVLMQREEQRNGKGQDSIFTVVVEVNDDSVCS